MANKLIIEHPIIGNVEFSELTQEQFDVISDTIYVANMTTEIYKLVKGVPNDQELGKAVRSVLNEVK